MNNVKIFQSDGNNIGITTQISRKVAAAIDAKYKGVAFKSSIGQDITNKEFMKHGMDIGDIYFQ